MSTKKIKLLLPWSEILMSAALFSAPEIPISTMWLEMKEDERWIAEGSPPPDPA